MAEKVLRSGIVETVAFSGRRFFDVVFLYQSRIQPACVLKSLVAVQHNGANVLRLYALKHLYDIVWDKF